MTYEEALEYIHGTVKFGIKLGLHNIGLLLELMGNPQNRLRFVHVAGTNGKGSTSAYIAGILEQAGYKTGLYTSPYIQRFTERIRIGKDEISREDLADITAFVKSFVDKMTAVGENHPTEFEIITAIALEYYCRQRCDVVVLEVGMGGRYDPTNIISVPELAVITTISYDHTERLGKTLPQIASEKAGIIKQGADVLIYGQGKEVEQVFEDECAKKGAHLHRTDFSSIADHSFGIDGQAFTFDKYEGLRISMLGRHQICNAVVAVKAAIILSKKGFSISEENIRKGLLYTRWPGRLEVLSKNPIFIIDGAHNPEGASVLKQAIDTYFPGRPVTFIMGVLRNKDYLSMMKIMLPGCKRFFAVMPDNPKAMASDELAKAAASYCNNVQVGDTIEETVRACIDTAEKDEIICAFGSLYYIGAVRDLFRL
ncbi:MAG: bifunctional folylpolyglutamate synthase/dihydrofolate synthase [Clostridiaceae bacterium]|nr:bifunctional folylpolyglutamate synthase/dihydrofolate synthase [Clostridiaceae bacterium]